LGGKKDRLANEPFLDRLSGGSIRREASHVHHRGQADFRFADCRLQGVQIDQGGGDRLFGNDMDPLAGRGKRRLCISIVGQTDPDHVEFLFFEHGLKLVVYNSGLLGIAL